MKSGGLKKLSKSMVHEQIDSLVNWLDDKRDSSKAACHWNEFALGPKTPLCCELCKLDNFVNDKARHTNTCQSLPNETVCG